MVKVRSPYNYCWTSEKYGGPNVISAAHAGMYVRSWTHRGTPEYWDLENSSSYSEYKFIIVKYAFAERVGAGLFFYQHHVWGQRHRLLSKWHPLHPVAFYLEDDHTRFIYSWHFGRSLSVLPWRRGTACSFDTTPANYNPTQSQGLSFCTRSWWQFPPRIVYILLIIIHAQASPTRICYYPSHKMNHHLLEGVVESLPLKAMSSDAKLLAQRYLHANAKRMHSVTNTDVCLKEK